jgi:hypothetical protein
VILTLPNKQPIRYETLKRGLPKVDFNQLQPLLDEIRQDRSAFKKCVCLSSFLLPSNLPTKKTHANQSCMKTIPL